MCQTPGQMLHLLLCLMPGSCGKLESKYEGCETCSPQQVRDFFLGHADCEAEAGFEFRSGKLHRFLPLNLEASLSCIFEEITSLWGTLSPPKG